MIMQLEKDFKFGMQRLEDAFHNIDRNRGGGILGCEFVHCNKLGFDEVKDYILNGVHAIWNFKISRIEEELFVLEYNGIKIFVSFDIKGAY